MLLPLGTRLCVELKKGILYLSFVIGIFSRIKISVNDCINGRDFKMSSVDMQILIKLGVSAVFGLIIGLERELKRKPVGLKTSLVISVVSCLLTIVSIESAYMFPDSDDVKITMDPLRLAAQIVSGIGFLGAGVILRRGNDSISGLTTAAMIWGAAGIGIAV